MPEYSIVSQVERNEIDEDSAQVEAGRVIRFKDGLTGVVGSVFVPKRIYTPDNVDALIRHELAQIRGVHTLGQ